MRKDSSEHRQIIVEHCDRTIRRMPSNRVRAGRTLRDQHNEGTMSGKATSRAGESAKGMFDCGLIFVHIRWVFQCHELAFHIDHADMGIERREERRTPPSSQPE